MAELRLRTRSGEHRTIQNVADAGIAGDFVVIRYNNGVVTFTEAAAYTDVEFDPTGDAPAEDGEGTDNPTDQ